LIISYLATFLGTNSLSVLMCRKAVNQSINLLHIHANTILLQLLTLLDTAIGLLLTNDNIEHLISAC